MRNIAMIINVGLVFGGSMRLLFDTKNYLSIYENSIFCITE